MGLFGFDLVKEAGGWEAAMTEEEITEMEKRAMICRPSVVASGNRSTGGGCGGRLYGTAQQLLSLPI